jgi:hypothetical protein
MIWPLICCVDLCPQAVNKDFEINNFRLWQESALIIFHDYFFSRCSASENLSLISSVAVCTMKANSRCFLQLCLTNQYSLSAKPIRNTNHWFNDVESTGTIYHCVNLNCLSLQRHIQTSLPFYIYRWHRYNCGYLTARALAFYTRDRMTSVFCEGRSWHTVKSHSIINWHKLWKYTPVRAVSI